jgi:hypothetical protein
MARHRTPAAGQLRLADVPDPLALVPVPVPEVVLEPLGGEATRLRRLLPPRNRLEGWIGRHLGWGRQVRVTLDAAGAAYWQAVDGRCTVAQIAGRLAQRFGFAPEASRGATLAFTRDLLVRGFIVVQLGPPAESTAP